jgi:hypothetical protein
LLCAKDRALLDEVCGVLDANVEFNISEAASELTIDAPPCREHAGSELGNGSVSNDR